ncbi:uncharacterized protein si:ch211-67e16.4 isoform X3 [Myxocyprinus asiaticus]|uniref:uncharacterized protein si:ch211-67e16.4 isoform X3 n=1 Tax=Myxocyprinus asiaticus TaxID=70543 RepID=UPI0022219A60|nr:uncharacterized protein si:ch211-67e16.4 isoform X3 [Myxocyprinus asiaticus]
MDVNLTISLIKGQMGTVIEKAVNVAVETVLGEMIRVVGLKFEEIKREMSAKDKENENIRKMLETHRCQMKTMRKYISVLATKDPNHLYQGDEDMTLHCRRGPTSSLSMCAKAPNPCARPRVTEPAAVAGPSWVRQQMHMSKAHNVVQEPLRTEHQLADLHVEEMQGSSVHKVDNSSHHLVDSQGLLCETSDPIWGKNPLNPSETEHTDMPDTSVHSAHMMTDDPTQTTTTQTVAFGATSFKIKQEEAEVEIICVKDEHSEAASTSRFEYSNHELHQPLVEPELGVSLDLPGSFQALQSPGTSAELAIPAFISVDPTTYTVMAKTAAERQREYRARRDADPVRREKYLRNERERWKRDIETGKKKRIGDLGEKAQRWRRKKWREAKERQKKREPIFKIIASPPDNTEPSLMVWLQP